MLEDQAAEDAYSAIILGAAGIRDRSAPLREAHAWRQSLWTASERNETCFECPREQEVVVVAGLVRPGGITRHARAKGT